MGAWRTVSSGKLGVPPCLHTYSFSCSAFRRSVEFFMRRNFRTATRWVWIRAARLLPMRFAFSKSGVGAPVRAARVRPSEACSCQPVQSSAFVMLTTSSRMRNSRWFVMNGARSAGAAGGSEPGDWLSNWTTWDRSTSRGMAFSAAGPTSGVPSLITSAAPWSSCKDSVLARRSVADDSRRAAARFASVCALH